MKDWTKGFRDMILPCGYLKYDVCQGTYACECSNGYWMTSEAMPSKDGDKAIDEETEVIDQPGEDLTDPTEEVDDTKEDENVDDQKDIEEKEEVQSENNDTADEQDILVDEIVPSPE